MILRKYLMHSLFIHQYYVIDTVLSPNAIIILLHNQCNIMLK